MRPVLVLTTLVAVALASHGTSLAQGVPTIDTAPSCRAAAAGAGVAQDFESCSRSEAAAREALVKQWSDFPGADRASCHRLTTTGTKGTYTELLTCLEMRRDARKLPDTTTVGQGLGK